MWVRVQVCRGPLGERLKRNEWGEPVEGELSVYAGRSGYCATLLHPDVTVPRQVLYPLYDVRVITFDSGLFVVGCAIATDADTQVIRDVRQAWYCVPLQR
jgi:hypothetical protein